MAERPMNQLPLEAALVELGGAIDYPTPSADLASRIRERVAREPVPRSRLAPQGTWWQTIFVGRPLRRALVLAVIALLVLAAIAAAIGIGLPGIRIVFGPPPSPSAQASFAGGSAPPSGVAPSTVSSPSSGPSASGPPGSDMGLGRQVAVTDVERSVAFRPRLPSGLGTPDAAYLDEERLTLVWAPGPSLPTIPGTRIGLLVTEFRGRVDPGYFEKTLTPSTTVTPVEVDGHQGYWISGEPHELFYVDGNGVERFETRRIVGDVLIWADADLTYRLETALPQAEAIDLAESLR